MILVYSLFNLVVLVMTAWTGRLSFYLLGGIALLSVLESMMVSSLCQIIPGDSLLLHVD